VLANGTIERVAPPHRGLPVVSSDVVGRVSKGVGLPAALPDVAGLAWRMPPQTPGGTPWDVLLASTAGGNLLSRVFLSPAASWSAVSLSSLMPLQYDGELWWLRAKVATHLDASGLDLDAIRERIAHGGLQFDIEQASGAEQFMPLARLRLSEVITDGRDVSFDPTLYTAPGVRLMPGWLTDFRRAAYRRSREGRDAE
jgi:hypothetical protein